MPILQVEIHQSTYDALQKVAERTRAAQEAGKWVAPLFTPELVAQHVLATLGAGVDNPGSWEHEMLYPLDMVPEVAVPRP